MPSEDASNGDGDDWLIEFLSCHRPASLGPYAWQKEAHRGKESREVAFGDFLGELGVTPEVRFRSRTPYQRFDQDEIPPYLKDENLKALSRTSDVFLSIEKQKNMSYKLPKAKATAVEKYQHMHIIFASPSPVGAAFLEAALIDKYRSAPAMQSMGSQGQRVKGLKGCKNILPGGDSSGKDFEGDGPFLTYIVYRSFKASCSSQIETARAVSSEMGEVNFAGHTFLTRFVVSVLPKTEYQSNPDYFHETMDIFARELKDLLESGITDPVTGEVWRFAVIGIKGDMPYLQKEAAQQLNAALTFLYNASAVSFGGSHTGGTGAEFKDAMEVKSGWQTVLSAVESYNLGQPSCNPNAFFVWGSPGSGKSCFVGRLMMEMLDRYENLIPLMLPVADLVKRSDPDGPDAVDAEGVQGWFDSYLRVTYGEDSLRYSMICQARSMSRVVFLFEGLEDAEKLSKAVESLIRVLVRAKNLVVVTSRPLLSRDRYSALENESELLVTMRLENLSDEQKRIVAYARLGAAGIEAYDNLLSRLRTSQNVSDQGTQQGEETSNDGAEDVFGNPMMLSMLLCYLQTMGRRSEELEADEEKAEESEETTLTAVYRVAVDVHWLRVLGSGTSPNAAPCASTKDCGDEANLLSWKRHKRPHYGPRGRRRPRYGSDTDDNLLGDASGLVSCYYSKTYEYPAGVNQSDSSSIDQLDSRCASDSYVNNDSVATCILNSNAAGYDYDNSNINNDSVCPYYSESTEYPTVTTPEQCKQYFTQFIALGQAVNVTLYGENYVTGIGHGVINGVRGNCWIMSYEGRKAVIFQVDIRSWSLEITYDTLMYLTNNQNPGGNCFVPDVKIINCTDIPGVG
ncbi:unnamed protein product [Cladocopium goreaui]|uniref:Uncharacterized protein n=1 Tax=Cladocopium goreaui TaxID=2562237 RepID=A0A9P1GE07_9DINO|nr:unnamed protein product [Cladocopium goreaui]